jgi:hypothetical protein
VTNHSHTDIGFTDPLLRRLCTASPASPAQDAT